MSTSSRREADITHLQNLDRTELVALWQKTHACLPPPNVRQAFLLRDAAFQLQSKAIGGHPASTRRILKSAKARLAAKLGLGRLTDVQGSFNNEFEDLGHGQSQVVPEPSTSKEKSKAKGGSKEDAGTIDQQWMSPRLDGMGRTASKDAAAEARSLARIGTTKQVPSPGARLIREWNGHTHVVDVVSNGYLLDGKTFSSLTAIARHITGAHWSGPRFFGL